MSRGCAWRRCRDYEHRSSHSELLNSACQCLESSRLYRSTAEKLRGRLGFAENHVFWPRWCAGVESLDPTHPCPEVRVRLVVCDISRTPTLSREVARTQGQKDCSAFGSPVLVFTDASLSLRRDRILLRQGSEESLLKSMLSRYHGFRGNCLLRCWPTSLMLVRRP